MLDAPQISLRYYSSFGDMAEDNEFLLIHVTIPWFNLTYSNREHMKDGSVGLYIKQGLKHKGRKGIEEKYKSLEHIWVEVPGNKNIAILVGLVF